MKSGIVLAAIALATAFLAATTPAYADPAAADREILHLLDEVGSSGCIFHRNGKDHDPDEARDHLAMKLRRAGKRIKTADDFIKYLATESSWTGKPYSIRCDDEATPSADWLNARLDAFRSASGEPGKS